MARGEFASAQEALIRGVDKSYGWSGEHDLYAMLADIAVLKRDHAGLKLYAPLAEEHAIRYGHTLYLAIAHRAWGVYYHLEGSYKAAEGQLCQALRLFRELEALWQAGRTLFELGDLARSSGDRLASKEHFQDALAAFETIQAVPDAVRIQQLMSEL
jgi:hypothetical protein